MARENLIYLDNNATTRIDPLVLNEMMPYLTESYGNAASNHAFGVAINQKIKDARKQIADLIGCDTNEIIFTSGATESINLAIKGAAAAYQKKGKHIITISTEHSAVLDTCKYLESEGFFVTYLAVRRDGLLDLEELENVIRKDTILISVMFVNNETGVIQPIEQIAKIAHANQILFMTDATQAVGKTEFNVNDLGIDLMPFSSHKFYGPKGVGALFITNRRSSKVKIKPAIHGGGHEKGLRSGTLNVPGIVGMGKAAEIASKRLAQDRKNIEELRDYLESEILKINDTFINGNVKSRLYNVSSISIKYVDADALIIALKNVALSNGSACTSALIEPSHVLVAMGLNEEEAYSTIRISLGRFNTKKEIEQVVKDIRSSVKRLRSMINN